MLTVANHLSLVLIAPDKSDHLAFAGWLAEHIGNDEVQFVGDALVVEPRYVTALVEALDEAGFEIQEG